MFHPIIFAKLSTPEPALPPTQPCCPRFLLPKGFSGPLGGRLLRRQALFALLNQARVGHKISLVLLDWVVNLDAH